MKLSGFLRVLTESALLNVIITHSGSVQPVKLGEQEQSLHFWHSETRTGHSGEKTYWYTSRDFPLSLNLESITNLNKIEEEEKNSLHSRRKICLCALRV